MHFYCTAKLSDKMHKTPEGYLVCQDVAITRVGELQYLPGELPSIARGENDIIIVERTEDDVFHEDTIRSFEGKPITIHHPKEFVGPHNYRELSVGSLNNVRRGTGDMLGKLVTDFLITDATAIGKVERRELREVSCGYEAEYKQLKPGRARQTDIRGNHVALVPRGRAGPECAIFDSAPKEIPMSPKEKFLAMMSKVFDGAPDDGDEETVDGLKAKLAKFQKDKEDADKKATDAQAVADKATADLKVANDALTTANADKAKLTTDLATVTAEVTALKKPAGKATNDAATVAKAEILAPGIAADTQDIQVASLKKAYATADGKAAIDVFTGGKEPTYDNAAAVDVIFNGASAAVAAARKAALGGGGGNGGNPAKTGDAKTTDFYQEFADAAAKAHPVPKL
jgi:hypothetical protein